MRKNKFWALPILLPSLVLVNSCQTSYQNNLEQIQENRNNSNLTFTNYFEKDEITNSQLMIYNLKNQITKIMNKYRLYEWNKYYETKNKHNNLDKSKILEIKFIDYSIQHVDQKLVNDKEDFKEELRWTKIYKNQDHQFRYFNDFINLIHEEKEKNQEDFLYLRWKLLSIEAAKKYKYNNLGTINKEIYKVNIKDWISAIKDLVILPHNVKPIQDLIKAFMNYYGINDGKFELAKVILASHDMYMRYSSKSELEMQKNPLWRQKAKRAINIHKKMNNYYQVLANSFTGDFDWDNQDKDMPNKEEVTGFLNQIKSILMKTIDAAYVNVGIKLNEYANEKDLNKGAMKNV